MDALTSRPLRNLTKVVIKSYIWNLCLHLFPVWIFIYSPLNWLNHIMYLYSLHHFCFMFWVQYIYELWNLCARVKFPLNIIQQRFLIFRFNVSFPHNTLPFRLSMPDWFFISHVILYQTKHLILKLGRQKHIYIAPQGSK